MQIPNNNITGQTSRRRPMADINMVPYLDILLVLLVIFMVTVPIFHQGIKVVLPKASAKKLPETKEKPLIVSLDKQGHYYLENGDNTETQFEQEKFLDRLSMIIKQREKTTQVLIKADKHLSYGKVLTLMDNLQQIGITKVGLVTQPLDPKKLRLKLKNS